MRSILLILTITALLFSPLSILGQSPVRESDSEFIAGFDTFIRKTLAAFPEIPAASIVVVKNDKPLFLRAYGLANKETGAKAGVDTVFYIASSTKSFMGLAAGLLDREGRIKFDDPMIKYARGITFKTPIPEGVTIRDLLTHTSGIKNPSLPFRMAYSGEVDDRDMDHVLANGTSYTEPDHGKYAYANLGYNIYGILLRLSQKKLWQDVLQERVFSPLKMRHTTAYISKARSAGWPMAEGYLFDPDSGTVIPSPLVKTDNNMQSAGGIVTTARDLSRWLRVNTNGGSLDGKQIVRADVMTSVHTGSVPLTRNEPPFTGPANYAVGWITAKYHDADIVYHDGGFPGWSCHISFMPGEKIGVAVMINESTAGGHVADLLAAYAYDRLLGMSDIDSKYAHQLDMFSAQYRNIKQSLTAAANERKKRTSKLTRPLMSCAGRYSNDLLGNIDVAVEQDSLVLRMGNIYVRSTPYTAPETIRVEMIPGQGEVIRFDVGPSGSVDSLSYNGIKFEKR